VLLPDQHNITIGDIGCRKRSICYLQQCFSGSVYKMIGNIGGRKAVSAAYVHPCFFGISIQNDWQYRRPKKGVSAAYINAFRAAYVNVFRISIQNDRHYWLPKKEYLLYTLMLSGLPTSMLFWDQYTK
jgi:hypothetical protein